MRSETLQNQEICERSDQIIDKQSDTPFFFLLPLQIRTVLLSIQALLSSPNPDDPLDENVARQWREDENAAINIAKDWTRIYAMQDN